MAGVRIGEEQIELVPTQLPRQPGELVSDLPVEVGVVLRELVQLDEVARAAFEAIPGRDQLAVLGGLPGQLAGAPWVVPRARTGELSVQLVCPLPLCGQVKGAP